MTDKEWHTAPNYEENAVWVWREDLPRKLLTPDEVRAAADRTERKAQAEGIEDEATQAFVEDLRELADEVEE